METLQKETKQKLDTMYSKLKNKENNDTGEESDFMESMKEMGFRDVDAEIALLEEENTDLVTAIEKEREATDRVERMSKNQEAQLRKIHEEYEELNQTFEECQNQLADAQAQISELETAKDAVDINDYIELQEQLDYAKRTKAQTIMFLDAEIEKLKHHLYVIYESKHEAPSIRSSTWTG